MRLVIDTSILIDHLNGRVEATALIEDAVSRGDELWGSYVIRTEVLAGMRRGEEERTARLLGLFEWVGMDEAQSDEAGALGRRYLRSHPGIDTADLIIAALTKQVGAELRTRNVKHFPMFPGLRSPY